MADAGSPATHSSEQQGAPRRRGDGAPPADEASRLRPQGHVAARRLGLPPRRPGSPEKEGATEEDRQARGNRSGEGQQQVTPSENRALYQRLTAFETVLVAGGVVVFVLLLYGMWGSFINPPLLGLAGALLLWPLREHRTVRALMVSGGFLLLLWFLAKLSAILIPFVVVYVMAYLFDPFVGYLRRRLGVSRRFSSLLISAVVSGALVLVMVLLVPRLAGQVEVLLQRLLDGVGNVRTWVENTPVLTGLESTGLVSRQQLLDQLNRLLESQSGRLASDLPAVIQGLAGSLNSLLGAVTIIAIMPVILFYTLKDYPFITRRLMELFPTLGGRRDYLVNASRIVGSYLRGQLLVCAIAGFNVSLLLSPLAFDVPLWLLIGLIAGIANLIPNLGAILSMVVAVAITTIFGDPWLLDTVAVVAVLTGQGLLEQSVLTPNIMSHQVGLHPVLIILSLLVFGSFMGVFGALIAVPATALIMTIYKAYRQEFTLDLSSYGMPASDPETRRRER